MNTPAERDASFASDNSPADVKAWAEMLRAAIHSIPPHKRAAVLEQIQDLIPKTPRRGGDILNNVYQLFKQDPVAQMKAPEVQAQLRKAGKDAEPQAVRNALNYLEGRRVLQRIGYGLYRMGDGSIQEGAPG